MAIEIDVGGDLVVVTLTGKDRWFALKRRLRIPTEKITSAGVFLRREVPPGTGLMIRLPGTYIPGVVHHGTYGLGANREFWAFYRQDEVLVITVEDWGYKRLVLGTENPAIDAMRLKQFID